MIIAIIIILEKISLFIISYVSIVVIGSCKEYQVIFGSIKLSVLNYSTMYVELLYVLI